MDKKKEKIMLEREKVKVVNLDAKYYNRQSQNQDNFGCAICGKNNENGCEDLDYRAVHHGSVGEVLALELICSLLSRKFRIKK